MRLIAWRERARPEVRGGGWTVETYARIVEELAELNGRSKVVSAAAGSLGRSRI